MSNRIEVFDVTVPGGTAIATPQETSLDFQRGRVDRLEIFVPPGPSGLVGFRVAHSGQSIIPRSGSAWVVSDNERIDWDMDSYPTGNAWSVFIYNVDVYEHTLQFRLHVTEFGTIEPVVIAPLDIQPIGTAEDFDPIPEEAI